MINNVEQSESESVYPSASIYKSVALSIPDSMTMPNGTKCGYTPNDCSVGDLDGDKTIDLVLKWDPSNSQDNSSQGYTGNVYLDGLKLDGERLWRVDLGRNVRAGAHYTQFMVYDLDGDGKAEVACKTAPGTKDGLGNFLSEGPASSDNDWADYRTGGSWAGFITCGPEYLTIFSGDSGAELATTYYVPSRDPSNGWGKDENYNRVDRFLACVAYLDGVRPSLVMCRGYYGRMALTAWDWRVGQLTQRWAFDTQNGYQNYEHQGNHNLSVGDVDDDGKDEIVYGASAFNDDGKPMYSTWLGHGDAMHMSDLIPKRKGLEVFCVHESYPNTNGVEIHDAKTGEIIIGLPSTSDIGRGMAADVDPRYPGYEFWAPNSSGTYSNNGTKITTTMPISTTGSTTYNFSLWWNGDLNRDFADRAVITSWNYNGNYTDRLLTTYNYGISDNNGTKSNPCFSGDILGDWREELIYRSADNRELRIFGSTQPTNFRFYTLLQDPQYRLALAWQNVAYNQPPHLGFYLGPEITRLISTVDTVICYKNSLTLSASDIPFDKIEWDNGFVGNTLLVNSAVQPVNEKRYIKANYQYFGWKVVDSIGVTFYQPQVELTQSGEYLYAEGYGLTSYQWYLDGQVLNGATAQSLLMQKEGVYSIKVDGSMSNCSVTSMDLIYSQQSITLCDNDKYNGVAYDRDTVLYQLFTLASGQDSVVKTTLKINKSYRNTIEESLCKGDVLHGLTTDGVFVESLKTSCNCDSVISHKVRLVTIDPSVEISGFTLKAKLSDAGYHWIDRSNNDVEVSSLQTFTPTSAGQYCVIVDFKGCTDTSSVFIVNPTALNNKMASLEVLGYPNPTSGVFHVKLGYYFTFGLISVINAIGDWVTVVPIKEVDGWCVDLSNQPNGLYVLTFQADNELIELKVLKLDQTD